MTTDGDAPTAASSPGPASADDWEHHWTEYGEVVQENPAQDYRRQIILELIREHGRPQRLIDIGSGQGDLLASLADVWPGAELVGIEASAEGVRQAAAKVSRARFVRHDLLAPDPVPADLQGWADTAVCSEVLEHLDEPEQFLRAATRLLGAGGVLIITVPGGPRTAFDRYIGHRRHYRKRSLETLLRGSGLDVERVSGVGFPFFDLYKLVVLAQGDRLARDVTAGAERSSLARRVMHLFGMVLRPGRNSRRFGWQMVAVARPGDTAS